MLATICSELQEFAPRELVEEILGEPDAPVQPNYIAVGYAPDRFVLTLDRCNPVSPAPTIYSSPTSSLHRVGWGRKACPLVLVPSFSGMVGGQKRKRSLPLLKPRDPGIGGAVPERATDPPPEDAPLLYCRPEDPADPHPRAEG